MIYSKQKKYTKVFFINFSLIVISLFFLIPFIWMILSSFKTGIEIIKIPPTFFPENFTFKNYLNVFEKLNFGRYIFNSFFVSTSITVIASFSSAIIGYVFAKFKFKGRELLFFICIAGLMIPLSSIILPMYLFMSKFKLVNSYIGLILPFAISPLGIFLMRQFSEGIPKELIEAARLDGASELRIFFKIIIPNVSAAIAAVSVFTFLFSWNQLWWPLMIISKPEMRTLTLAMANLSVQIGKRFDMIVTSAALAVLPVMIVFAIAQKQVVKGVTLTGMKL
ncbi:MAG: carbohydrate ABC transporter permease [Actinobacteria bacterium]|nr:carbohydrate ABC transporter permease [Actinomycetota bacterium]